MCSIQPNSTWQPVPLESHSGGPGAEAYFLVARILEVPAPRAQIEHEKIAYEPKIRIRAYEERRHERES